MILLASAGLFAVQSCTDEGLNDPRKETIEVHALEDCSDEPLTACCLGVMGGASELYVKSNVDQFNVFWQDAAPTPWARVTSCEKTSRTGVWKVGIEFNPRSEGCLYYRRGGTLSISAAEQNLGMFLPVYQGAATRVQDHFDSFAYGSSDPHVDEGEVNIDQWSTTLKNKGFDSEKVGSANSVACYARNGYLKLGDSNGNKGSLITPYNELYRYDSLLVVTKDNLPQETTRIMLTAPYINIDAEDPSQMWGEDSWYMVFIEETEKSPLTTNTRIKITSGESGEGLSRLFVDDICVMRLVDGLDEDYFKLNQGSGKDKILAARNK